MTFTREEIEHAYNSTRRLRLRLSALARLAAGHAQHPERASRVVAEATDVLEACGCTLHLLVTKTEFAVLALSKWEKLNEASLERSASRLAVQVASAGEAVVLKKQDLYHDGGNWLSAVGIQSYLGIPLFSDGQLIGVAGLFGGPNRDFNEEDEWWLKIASQPVVDELAYGKLEARLRELEKTLAHSPGALNTKNGDQPDAEASLSVLVVDDDRNINDILCEYLSLEGYKAEAAFDGLEAMRKFRPAEHDVVMTDVAMPLMNGWELIAALRVRAPELPVVLITGYGSGNWNEEYLRTQGVCAVISKPLDLSRLADVLKKIKTRRL